MRATEVYAAQDNSPSLSAAPASQKLGHLRVKLWVAPSPPRPARRLPGSAAAMLLLRAARSRAGGPPGRSPSPLAALSQVLKLERNRRDGVMFPLQRLARNLVPGAEEAAFNLFQPGLPALQRAEVFFTSGRGHAIDYVSSAVRMDHAPPSALPEVGTRPGERGGRVGWAWRPQRCGFAPAVSPAAATATVVVARPAL